MLNFFRAASNLEQAAKTLESGDEMMTAHHLGKAEKIILKSRFNSYQIRALIALYDRVIPPNRELSGTIPIRHNCEEMKKILLQYTA
jgi:hypothetical protein